MLLQVTPRLRQAAATFVKRAEDDALPEQEDVVQALAEAKSLTEDSVSVSHRTVITVSQVLRGNSRSGEKSSDGSEVEFSMRWMLRGTKVVKPPEPEKPPKSPEFLAQMERLRAQAQEQEYQALVKGLKEPASLSVDPADEGEIKPGQMAKEIKEQLSAIVNILLSVASVAWALWYWTASSMNISLATRTLLSLFGAGVILVAEVFIYTRYKFKVDDARQKERGKKEKVQVISSYEISGGNVREVSKDKAPVVAIGSEKNNGQGQASLRKRTVDPAVKG